MEVTLQPKPRMHDVVLEQVRIVGLNLRPVALVIALVLAAGTVMIGSDILRGRPGFDGEETFPTVWISFFFPFAVWLRERRFGPAFLWTLPVERRRLALAKVFAGWLWFTAALAVFAGWLLALVLLAGDSPAENLARIPFTATIAAYLYGSALVVGLRYPLRWLLGAAGLVFVTGNLSQMLERFYGVESLLGSRRLYFAGQHSYDVWQTVPPPAQFAISACVLLGLGLAALWAAASRHREHRRN